MKSTMTLQVDTDTRRRAGRVGGDQWKSLFLSESTEIRSWNYGESERRRRFAGRHHRQAQMRADQPPSPSRPEPQAPPRDPTPGEGWKLPERRKYRFRLEDVAFD